MKTNKITKTIIGLFAGLMLLLMSASAQAALVDLIIDGQFSSSTAINPYDPGNLLSGMWYGDPGWKISDAGAYANESYYLKNVAQHLFQTVEFKSAIQGPVQVSFDYTSSGLTPGQTNVMLYGSNDVPTYGSFGDQLGMYSGGFLVTTSNSWIQNCSFDLTNMPVYKWYTLDIFTTLNKEDDYFGVDNVSLLAVSAVPIPSAVLLLGSGLIGIVAVRRRFSK